MATPIRSSVVSVDYPKMAGELLEQARRDFVSPQDIVDLSEVDPNFEQDPAKEYNKLGDPFIFFLIEHIHTQKLQAACQLAVEELGEVNFPEIVENLALARFGRGTAEAISYLTHIAIINSGCLLVHLRNTVGANWDEFDPNYRSHACIFLGASEERVGACMRASGWRAQPCFELLQKQSGVILDLFLRVASPFSQYKEEAKPLHKYIEQWGLYFVAGIEKFDPKNVRELLKEVDLVYERATKLLPSVTENLIALTRRVRKQRKMQLSEGAIHSPRAGHLRTLSSKERGGDIVQTLMQLEQEKVPVASTTAKLQVFAEKQLHTNLIPKVIGVLEEIFPKVSWNAKVDPSDLSWTLTSTGSQGDLLPIYLQFENWGIAPEMQPLKQGSNHALMLYNCYPRCLQLYSHLVAETGKFISRDKEVIVNTKNGSRVIKISTGKAIVDLMISYLGNDAGLEKRAPAPHIDPLLSKRGSQVVYV